MAVTVTRTTITTTTTSSGLGSSMIVGSPRALTQPLGLLRLLQLLSTCVAFSLVASVGAWMGPMGNWSMFTWCFCFSVTLIILIVELGGLQSRFPLSWRNFPITFACYAALFCLSSSIIYPTTYVQFLSHGRTRDHAIAATAFSCIACVAYATEVAWTRARPGEITGYMATVPGLLKVLETFVACIIFAFISNPSLYQHKPALEWCVAVYAICFILAAIAILLNLGDCTNMLPIPFPSFLSGLALLSVILYATALVLWPLYQFDERYGGRSQRARDGGCAVRHPHSVCDWDRRLAVAILTAINLLAYVADLVYSARLVFVKV
ncbi:myeloid-associated differentiation marker [Marmota marmota marmota]|uniref:Myeloid associated differentiation marker n=1 Tax=Marmota marmota marmota TaxID=9994 RepID=A0A8C5YSH1_MARMA|nr:myeloid-associated differentiation marker [Marmota marmota marmota]XP_015360904.1 myeloid-associated differentiation marker [Marmota marmota marmota]XP_015360905.1 myeloid-associated differentiation marker [Marmota marmota marmota]XP_015360906.1 myeloid-associated differentiation marker [Marmota marmota marmota]XP_027777300.1 myeloid-associated differentiation marker [Marmota flaviventris]XP_027777301.1 myeloid-associated differentiation marker [Marmota flaviventris]XP_027777302.1 myeloid-